jgi:YD repeat-containing protein
VQNVKRAVGTALAQTTSTVTYTYTLNGLLATIADAKDNLTTYAYDGQGRRIQTRYPDKVTAGVSTVSPSENNTPMTPTATSRRWPSARARSSPSSMTSSIV